MKGFTVTKLVARDDMDILSEGPKDETVTPQHGVNGFFTNQRSKTLIKKY